MAGEKGRFLFMLLFTGFIAEITCDTPANCTYEEIKGIWIFQMGKGGQDRRIDCSKPCKNWTVNT